MKKSKVKFDISIFLDVLMEFLLIADIVLVLIKGEVTVTSYIVNTVIAMAYVLIALLEYIKNKKQKRKEDVAK